jgi:hypothetical protein
MWSTEQLVHWKAQDDNSKISADNACSRYYARYKPRCWSDISSQHLFIYLGINVCQHENDRWLRYFTARNVTDTYQTYIKGWYTKLLLILAKQFLTSYLHTANNSAIVAKIVRPPKKWFFFNASATKC